MIITTRKRKKERKKKEEAVSLRPSANSLRMIQKYSRHENGYLITINYKAKEEGGRRRRPERKERKKKNRKKGDNRRHDVSIQRLGLSNQRPNETLAIQHSIKLLSFLSPLTNQILLITFNSTLWLRLASVS